MNTSVVSAVRAASADEAQPNQDAVISRLGCGTCSHAHPHPLAIAPVNRAHHERVPVNCEVNSRPIVGAFRVFSRAAERLLVRQLDDPVSELTTMRPVFAGFRVEEIHLLLICRPWLYSAVALASGRSRLSERQHEPPFVSNGRQKNVSSAPGDRVRSGNSA